MTETVEQPEPVEPEKGHADSDEDLSTPEDDTQVAPEAEQAEADSAEPGPS